MTRSRTSLLQTSLALGMVGLVSVAACAQLAGIEERKYEGLTASPMCIEYCETVLEACDYGDDGGAAGASGTGDKPVKLYTSMETCLGVCGLLAEGDEVEPASTPNSVACRLNQARQALNVGQTDAAGFCLAAGPGGNGRCGTDCQSYCHLVEEACAGINAKVENCVQKCEAFGDSERFHTSGSQEFDHSGDTVQCRLVHVSSATVNKELAETHCPHAAFRPNSWCVDEPTCERYCRVVSVACEGENAQYESDEQCMQTCAALDLGKQEDEEEDTIGCRIYHGVNSLSDAKTHCPHAGPTGDGHCGKDIAKNNDEGKDPEFAACRPYCRILEAACDSNFAAQWDSQEACVAECDQSDEGFKAALDQFYTVESAEDSGDTLLCRTLHAVRAFEDPSQCDAAFGASPCN